MTYATRTILALAAIAPLASALEVADADFKLGLKLMLQVRAEKSVSTGIDGNTFNVSEGVADSTPDAMDFYVRRARVGFAGSYKGEYKFAYILRNDDQDKNGATARGPVTNVAYLERVVKQESTGLDHSFKMGLDYAFFNGSSAVFSSASTLFPTLRATSGMLAPRGAGVAYKLSNSKVTWGVDVQNNTGDSVGAATQGSHNQGEGLFYGTRVQVIGYDSDEKGHMKPVESFMGKDGQGVLISAEYGLNQNDNGAVGTTTNTTGYGIEVLGHMNAITALAEYRQTVAKADKTGATDNTKVTGTAYLIQAGYAMPLGDKVIEPAIRWTRLNNDSSNSEATDYSGEYGTSGYSYDLGVNYYISGHTNKVQVAYQNWRGEGGGTATQAEAKASIIRAQWQLSF